MDEKQFQQIITNITVILSNYLIVAKQSGKIIISLEAESGNVKRCIVTNAMEVPVK